MSLTAEKREPKTRNKRREVLRRLDEDFKKLYVKMNKHYTLNNFEALTHEEVVVLDAGKDPDVNRQKEYDKGRKYFTSLMALKAKYLELTGVINVAATEKGDLVFEPGANYKPEVIEATQQPATAQEIAETNKPSEGVKLMRGMVERVAPHLKRV